MTKLNIEVSDELAEQLDRTVCPNCQGPIAIRNPTGTCDHLYFPDMLTPEAKQKIGQPTLDRIQGACMSALGAAMARRLGSE